MSITCQACNAKLIDNTQTCPKCGHALVDSNTDIASIPVSSESQAAIDNEKTRVLLKQSSANEDKTRVLAKKGAASVLEQSGRDAAPKPDSSADERILQNRYRLKEILGRGGFGAVYLAEDVKLKRVCVVKRMLIPEGTSPDEIERYRINFDREAGLLVHLNHPGHSSIPEIYDYFSDTTGNYLVMKYIEGQNLKDILDANGGKLPWRQAAGYIIDVCDALNYMHTQEGEPVMHRDIKPANILLGKDGRVWLVDFGLAKANPVQASGNLMLTQASGTIGYTALEQWLGKPVPVSDVYSVGATLHHLATGLHPSQPFEHDSSIEKIETMHSQFVPIRKVDRKLPKSLEPIIAGATAAKPDDRPDALQLKQKLEALISGAKTSVLYTFKSGESAETTRQLADLCAKYRREAQDYLYNGDFEHWFQMINRNDLSEAATQAVKQGKNQSDGLKKFLKLIAPNLFLRRLVRAGWRITRFIVQFILVLVVVVALVVVGGSYASKWIIQQAVGGYPWDFSYLVFDGDNRFGESEINDASRIIAGSYLDDIQVDLQSPDKIEVDLVYSGYQFHIPLTLRLEDGNPHFYFSEINGLPLYLIADNVSQGVNNGIDKAFQKSPGYISKLEMRDDAVIFGMRER